MFLDTIRHFLFYISQLLFPTQEKIRVQFISSLRRLEICADEIADSATVCTSATVPSNIEQFILDSSSTIIWNDLSRILSKAIRVRLLKVSLIGRSQNSMLSCIFPNIHTLSLGLLETSFSWIIQLVAIIPFLVKLKLTGLVDSDGFVTNQRWSCLFESSPNLLRIFVSVSLEQGEESYQCDQIQILFRALNLNLKSDGADDDCDSYYGKVNRWWTLKGVIIRQSSYKRLI